MQKYLPIAASIIAFALAGSAQAANVALISAGASFVSASSSIDLASELGTLTTMQNDPISDTPTPWYAADGDTRYIFGSYDPSQTYTIDLGKAYSLGSFSASYGEASGFADRAIATLAVFTSTDDQTFIPYLGLLSSSPGLFTLSGSAVSARYITYDFGPASDEYPGYGGSGVLAVTADTASAVPEPAGWAMMIGGVSLIGCAMRRRERATAKVSSAG